MIVKTMSVRVLLLRARWVKKSLPREWRSNEWKSTMLWYWNRANHPLWSRKFFKCIDRFKRISNLNVAPTKF